MTSFDQLNLQPALLRAVRDLGFTEPTPIQAASIPPALEGKDILASAATGSGKSAAFGLPLIQALAGHPRGKTRALILAPTRELAAQIAEHLAALAKHTKITVAAVFGGVSFGTQAAAFRRGTDIIVATPGRLLDHAAQGTARFDNIAYLVIDEADRMLDMGFLPTVRRILKMLPAKRQSFFFSATIPPPVAILAREMLHDPVRVDLVVPGAPAAGIAQTIYSVNQDRKGDLLLELLKDNAIYSAIAFTRTKARANRLATLLAKNNVPSERIHGDRSQAQRNAALRSFSEGHHRVLVATDVAARGIDVANVAHVINFDLPKVAEDFVHRVGRTGRASAHGVASTFAVPAERNELRKIEKILSIQMKHFRVSSIAQHAA